MEILTSVVGPSGGEEFMRLEPPPQKGLENKQARSPREDAVGAALPGPGRQPSGDRSVPRPQTPASGTETEVSSMPPGLATCRDRDRTQVPPLGSPSPCCPCRLHASLRAVVPGSQLTVAFCGQAARVLAPRGSATASCPPAMKIALSWWS